MISSATLRLRRHTGAGLRAPSHPLRGADAEDGQTVGDDLSGRLAQREPRGVQVAGRLVALGQHPAES